MDRPGNLFDKIDGLTDKATRYRKFIAIIKTLSFYQVKSHKTHHNKPNIFK